MRKLVGSRWEIVGGNVEYGRWNMEGGYWKGVKASSRCGGRLNLKTSGDVDAGQVAKRLLREAQR